MGKRPNIEDRLRQVILTAGISRYQLAKLSGVSQAALSLFVNRKRTITLESAAKVAAVLGLELRPKASARKGR